MVIESLRTPLCDKRKYRCLRLVLPCRTNPSNATVNVERMRKMHMHWDSSRRIPTVELMSLRLTSHPSMHIWLQDQQWCPRSCDSGPRGDVCRMLRQRPGISIGGRSSSSPELRA